MRTCLLILCLWISSACASPDSWSNYQYNATHTGFVKTRLDFSEDTLLWKKSFASDISDLAINTNNIYFVANHVLYAIDKSTGNMMWTATFTGEFSPSPPAATDEMVYFLSDDHHYKVAMNAYNAKNGDVIFSKSNSSLLIPLFSPTLFQDNIYSGCGFSTPGLCAYNGLTGELLWQNGAVFGNESKYNWTPAVTEDYVITYTDFPKVFDRHTGKLLAVINTDRNPNFPVNTAPVVATDNNAVIYINNNRLVIFDLTTNKIRFTPLVDHYTGQPVYAHGVIYAINNGILTAHAIRDNSLLWQWQPEDHAAINKNLILTQNVILAANDDNTYAIDVASHKSVWQYKIGGNLALSKGQLFIVANKPDANKNRNIAAIQLKTLPADLTVNVMKTRIPSYFDYTHTYTPDVGLYLLDGDAMYTLSDGTNVSNTLGQMARVLKIDKAYKGLDGNLHFTFKATPNANSLGGSIFQEYYPYNSYKGDIQAGGLSLFGSVEMVAAVNTNIATLFGIARITNNPPTLFDHTDPNPIYYAANVDDLVLFKMTYKLTDTVWTLDTFKHSFVYTSDGEVDFTKGIANSFLARARSIKVRAMW